MDMGGLYLVGPTTVVILPGRQTPAKTPALRPELADLLLDVHVRPHSLNLPHPRFLAWLSSFSSQLCPAWWRTSDEVFTVWSALPLHRRMSADRRDRGTEHERTGIVAASLDGTLGGLLHAARQTPRPRRRP